MNPPDVFITGLGHSGTSWCIDLFQAAGFDIGSELKHANPGQGREWLPAWRLINEAGPVADWTYRWCPDPQDAAAKRDDIGPQLAELDWPPAVKIPGVNTSVFWDYIQPRHVVVMIRDPHVWANRVATKPDVAMEDRPRQYRIAVEHIQRSLASRPHTFVEFERAVGDADYAYRSLGELCHVGVDEFTEIHSQLNKPEWVTR